MAKKLRLMVTQRKELCDRVLGALTVQGSEIGGQLEEYLAPVLTANEDLPDLSTLLLLFGRRLEGYCDAMVAADQIHLAELARLQSLRDQAIEPMRGLKESIFSLRATVQGLFGRGGLLALGLDFNIARNPQGVLRQAEIIRGLLADGERALAASRWINGYFDRDNALAEFDRDIEPLRGVLTRQIEQRKRIDTAKVRKDQAIEAFDHHFIRVTRLVESAFRVADETELADRIRPTVRRLGRDGGSGAGEPEVVGGQTVALTGRNPRSADDAGDYSLASPDWVDEPAVDEPEADQSSSGSARQQDGIDGVNDAVRSLDVGLNDVSRADFDSHGGIDGQSLALQGLGRCDAA